MDPPQVRAGFVAPDVGYWATPGDRARIIVDEQGVEWEVYDESEWTLEMALDWDVMPQSEDPGLIFSSAASRRRLRPCPHGWREVPDAALLALLATANIIL